MGLATAGCLRRIFRLSWLGHQSRLPAPSVGWLRGPTVATGHLASLSSEFMSPTTALWWWVSDTGESFQAGGPDTGTAAVRKVMDGSRGPGNRHTGPSR